MIDQVRPQTIDISVINHVDCRPKVGVAYSFMVRTLQRRRVGVADVVAESCPAAEAVFTRDRELCIAQREGRCTNAGVRYSREAWMKFPDPLKGAEVSSVAFSQQVLRLMLQMLDVRTEGQRFRGHVNSPFNARLTSASAGRKVRSL
jgi:hypothetical protein